MPVRRTNKKSYRRKMRRKPRNIVKIVKSVLNRNRELKFSDAQAAAANSSYTGTIYDLTGPIAVGTSDNTRIGNSIRVKGVLLDFYWQGNYAAATYLDAILRYIVFRGVSENGVTPTVGDILEYSGTFRGPISPYRFDTRSKYQILKTGTSVVNQGGAVLQNNSGYPGVRHYKMYIPIDKTVTFNDAGTIENGGIYLLHMSSLPSPDYPTFTYSWRVYFYDS